MKTFILFCALCVCACAEDNNYFTVNGMTVHYGEYDISRDRVEEVVYEVEDAVNRFYPGLDLMDLLWEKGLDVYYFDLGSDSKYRGIFYASNNSIEVNYKKEYLDQPAVMCMENYYVLGHELMHFVTEYYLNEKSVNHDNPNIWLSWGMRNMKQCETAEYWFYTAMAYSCGYWVHASKEN